MKFIAGYTKREDLPPLKQVDCKVLLFVGTESPYYEGTIQLMNKYNNANTAWIKVQNAGGLITEERPDSMVTSMILFLQGMGYLVKQKIEQSATPSITIE
jgi:pimeloyl-ACP methyl ester carboxylesterase